jgi:hypothetical protein
MLPRCQHESDGWVCACRLCVLELACPCSCMQSQSCPCSHLSVFYGIVSSGSELAGKTSMWHRLDAALEGVQHCSSASKRDMPTLLGPVVWQLEQTLVRASATVGSSPSDWIRSAMVEIYNGVCALCNTHCDMLQHAAFKITEVG